MVSVSPNIIITFLRCFRSVSPLPVNEFSLALRKVLGLPVPTRFSIPEYISLLLPRFFLVSRLTFQFFHPDEQFPMHATSQEHWLPFGVCGCLSIFPRCIV